MKYIDIHSHLNFSVFDLDREEVVQRMLEQDLFCINIGTNLETSKIAVEFSQKYKNMYAIIGLHPIYVNFNSETTDEKNSELSRVGEIFDEENYVELVENKKVVGVGECGLDYYHLNNEGLDNLEIEKRISLQKENFRKQIDFALKYDLPIMIHCRDAYDDVLDILEDYKNTAKEKLRGDVHFYSGNTEQAKRFLDLDFDISFTGVITFAKQYQELVEFVPLNRIHAETDCPYVAPVPHRGKRNEPVFSIEVVKKIAEIKKVSLEEVQKQLIENAKRLFKLDI